ncbi:leucine-rich repeat domain-containing protein [Rhodospirillum rubrum]|uniref:leucine-rich repeat domain-containing protein n=1 Tax=Rhodospirillum rubrum TaxID=1085 RepID=UPI001A933B69|nr:leucine-rich repeat domain-containing protein [Rhodospirillum rubrum]
MKTGIEPHQSDAEQAFREAEIRIAAWRPDGALDLAIDGLERIPDSIKGLTELTALRLTYWDKASGSLISARLVTNLTPLAGLKSLQSIDLGRAPVTDLTPLADLKSLQSINLIGTKVTDLAPLAGLENLQSINLSETQITELAPLAGLENLQSINFWSTSITDLAPLAGLKSLQSINFWRTPITDFAPLAGLENLQSLTLNETRVTDLAPLEGLENLQSIYLSETQVTNLAPLVGLKSLQSINLSQTQVTDLAPLVGLENLQSIDLSETQVTDLTPLAGLKSLWNIECSGCRIASVPDGFFDTPALHWVICSEGALADIPAEVLSQGGADNCLPRIRAHLRDLEQGAERMRDAKMLVLGNGRVGKTQVCRQLLGAPFEENANSTHAIAVRSFERTAPDGGAFRIQLWDFGGQDIYHGTHTLFMRSRGIYLIAWTPKQEDNDTHTWNGQTFRNHTLPYWLAQVAAFGGHQRPLMVVQTQADTVHDRRPLSPAAREKAEAFETWFELDYSAKTGRRQASLRDTITDCYAEIEQPLIGVVRARVKRALEDLIAAGAQRTLTLAAFRDLCTKEGGVADPALFLETLHNAGTLFHRPGFFGDDIILDQEWAIRAIYSVFERDSNTYAIIGSLGGRFTRSLLGRTLWDNDYTRAEQDLFLSMMRSCGICFENRPGDADAGLEADYIAPDLLPDRLNDCRWKGDDAEQRQDRHYTPLPSALIRGVLCAIGQQAGSQADYWRHGLRLTDNQTKSEGLITSDEANGVLTLSTRRGNAGDLLETLIEIVAREEDRLGLKPTRVTGAPTPRAHRPDRPDAPADPAGKLDPKRPPRQETEWFFSYARDSEKANGAPVARFCEAVRQKTGITVRRDVEELRYGDEIKAFMSQLAKGDRIFIWITDAYLKSPSCMFELHEIWRECKENQDAFEKRVTVVLEGVLIRHETDLKRYRDFWRRELEAVEDRFKTSQTPVEVAKDFDCIKKIVATTDEILIFVRNKIRYASIEEMWKREFPDG